MVTQTPDTDTATVDARLAVLRADIKNEFSGLESRLMQRLVELEHNQKVALLQSESRQQTAMLEMGARLQENLAVFRAQYETTVPTLATKVDLLEHKASIARWFLGVAVGLFVAFGGAGFTLYRLASHG